MATLMLAGKKLTLRPQNLLGTGGEADVYRVGSKAVKIFKNASHADYAGQPAAQAQAKAKLKMLQAKLPKFPKPPKLNIAQLVTPEELVLDANGNVAGYAMRIIDGAEPLSRLGNRGWREQFAPGDTVTEYFRTIHEVVAKLHAAKVVIGDFNDMNVLLAGGEVNFIDADSFQYGGFDSVMFTMRFVDPLLLMEAGGELTLKSRHTELTDWYAYNALLLQSLVCVDPYGGIYRPKDKSKRLTPTGRLLQRVTIFDPEVQYPKPALPLETLPDELLDHFEQVFAGTLRAVFPTQLLANLRYTACTKCGTEHARRICPSCSTANAHALKATVRGNVTQTFLLRTNGTVLCSAVQGGKLHYLYHEGDKFKREDGETVLDGAPVANMRYGLSGRKTVIAHGSNLAILSPGETPVRHAVDSYGNVPMLATNSAHVYWLQNGILMCDGRFGPERVGDVLQNQTLFWVGETFGFGFYRAGGVTRAFVFNTTGGALNDTVRLPAITGRLLDADCVFSDKYAWVFLQIESRGTVETVCTVYDAKGQVVASADTSAGDNDWMQHIHGKVAAGDKLFATTDQGIVRIGLDSGLALAESEFTDTEPYVNAHTKLLVHQGLYLVEPQLVTHIELRSS